MITLKELIELVGTVTKLDVDLRQEDGLLIKKYEIGTDIHISRYMQDDINNGKLEVIHEPINKYGMADKRGQSIMYYRPIFKPIPKELLRAEVTTLCWVSTRYGGATGYELRCFVQQSTG